MSSEKMSTAELLGVMLRMREDTHSYDEADAAIDAVAAMAKRIAKLEAALKPLADMAVHFPARRTYGNRPTTGEIYEVESPQAGVASITVEHLRAAAALLVSTEAE